MSNHSIHVDKKSEEPIPTMVSLNKMLTHKTNEIFGLVYSIKDELRKIDSTSFPDSFKKFESSKDNSKVAERDDLVTSLRLLIEKDQTIYEELILILDMLKKTF